MDSKHWLAVVVALVTAAPAPTLAGSTLDRPVGRLVPYALDSGQVSNPAGFTAPVLAEPVTMEGAAWLRLHFGTETALRAGTFIRITATADGEVQRLDAATLAEWGGASAYFNGDTVTVELIAGPATAGNRLTLEHVAVPHRQAAALDGPAMCGVCGPDERAPSDELWTGRLLPAGCTASVWNPASCLVSAGHCVDGSMVVEFGVPASNPDCSLNHPPVADQFPILEVLFLDAGIGHDWSVLMPGPNGLDQLPYERYGQLRPIAGTLPGAGSPVDVWGYGVDWECGISQSQQTSGGVTTGVFADRYEFDVDVSGGNSGSALVHDGGIIGIVTHCHPDCPNTATRVDDAGFALARGELCGASCPWDLDGGGVGVSDVLVLLAGWGTDPGGPPDLDGDGTVGITDFLIMLANWGPCP